MPDMFSVGKRSEIMSRVRSRGNKATELRLIEVFRSHAITGWRRNRKLFGSPDFVFPAERLAVFVDGCFWHGCPVHGSIPASNRPFWQTKLHRNLERDKLVCRELQKSGWRVLRIWQHELVHPARVARRVGRMLS
jgi:DNA mismatch endonuclease (patch repair protein)